MVFTHAYPQNLWASNKIVKSLLMITNFLENFGGMQVFIFYPLDILNVNYNLLYETKKGGKNEKNYFI